MSASGFLGLSVLGGPISTNTTRTAAAGTQAEDGGSGSNRGLFLDPRMVPTYGVAGSQTLSQTGPMDYVEAVGKVIV